ncbi:phage tail protein [Ensifer aridi]|uniref:phage tail protein n=1 Tax=Ensifer aridi TaxID=1708715 RepID=UPI0004299528|nr:hypothetical protein [Ensifer aridi]
MPGAINLLAFRLYQISNGKKRLALKAGLDSDGNYVVSDPTASMAFDYVELFDGSADRLRLSLRVLDGTFHRLAGSKLSLSVRLPIPLARYADKSRRVIVNFKLTLSAGKDLFAKDGTLGVELAYVESYAPAAPGNQNNLSGRFSLNVLSNPPKHYQFERHLFATNAAIAIDKNNFPLPPRVLRDLTGLVIKDIVAINPNPNLPSFPNPRSIQLRPVGIRRADRGSTACGFLAFGARIRVGPAAAEAAGTARLILDEPDRDVDTVIRVERDIDFDLIPDAFHQPDLGAGEAEATNSYFCYLRVGPLPPQIFETVWNRRIAPPYLGALRTISDAADLSFVPLLTNVSPIAPGGGDFEALFDVVQPDVATSEKIADIVVAAIRPVGQSATFLADATFPGLLTHEGKPVVRRVRVTVEKKSMAETFEWFDAPPLRSSTREISVTIEAEGSGAAGSGGRMRIGALDLDVPASRQDDAGQLRIHYAITFEPVDPAAVDRNDPKGRAGRARLPRRGEALPRIRARIERFDLHDVRPGAQDPVPDAGLAFDAVVEDLLHADVSPGDPGDERVARERRIARDLARDVSAVIVDGGRDPAPDGTPFFLRGEEITAPNRNRRLALTLHRARMPQAKKGTAPRPRKRTIVLDPEPFAVSMIDVPTFGVDGEAAQEYDGEIANWELSEAGGAKWEILGITDGFDLYFPPQATGEAFEKGKPWTTISPAGAAAVAIDFRLSTVSRLALQASYYRQRYAEAPWNVRRVLGFAGDRAPGASIKKARFEYLYGLAGRITAPGLRLAELGSRIGGIRDPLPARPRGITRTMPEPEPGKTASPQPLVEAELYDRFRDLSASFSKVYGTRIAHFEAYREGSDNPLAIEEKVAFELRADAALDDEPWNPASPSAGFRGGATRGFESEQIYNEVVRNRTSTRGQIVKPGFSALGGSGFVRAFFADGKTRIVSDTSFGRTHTYAVERIGRIGVFWNIAKHVIVYERTVLPHDQFLGQQDGQHFGRPLGRKAKEYIDIIEPERAYPEKGAAPRSPGFVEACLFRTRRIPVDGRWGRDIEDGWIVPLWRKDADKDLYPKPDVRLQLAAAHADAAAVTPSRFSDPGQLVFYTSTRLGEGDDPNAWAPREDIDFVNVPPPLPVGQPVIDAADPDGKATDEVVVDPLLARCTFDLDAAGAAVNLVNGRTQAEPIGAVLDNVTMMRARASGKDGGAAGQALALRQELERILAEARRLESVLDGSLATARAALASLPRLATKSGDEIEAALNAEVDRLGEIKTVIHREAAAARTMIAAAAARARGIMQAAKPGWTDAPEIAKERLWKEVDAVLFARADTLSKTISEVVAGLQTLPSEVNAGIANILARRIEEALAPVRATIVGGVGRVSESLSRLEGALGDVRAGMGAALRKLQAEAAELDGRLQDAKANKDLRSLINQYEAFHGGVLTTIDALATNARRQLPLSIKKAVVFPKADGTLMALDGFLTGLRAALVSLHDEVLATIQTTGLDAAEALEPIQEAMRGAIAAVTKAGTDLGTLAGLGQGVIRDSAAALAAFTNDLDAFLGQIMFEIHDICATAADPIEVIRDKVVEKLDLVAVRANELKGNVRETVDGLKGAVGGLLDEVGNTVAEAETAIENHIALAQNQAAATIDALESALVRAIDDGIAVLRNKAGDLAQIVKDAAAKLKGGADAIVDGLRNAVPPAVADDIRVLEEGYRRLSGAPTFQNPGETLALVRAAGTSPILPNLKFNRERIAYFFDDARDAIRTSPVVALMNRLDDDLKALGIRVPTDEILERLVPKGMENFDFGKLFPDLGGLKLDGLFKNLRMPPSLNDKVKLTHGFDKASLTAWAKAEAAAAFPDRSEIFDAGPLKLSMVQGRFDALADLAATPDGVTKKTTRAEITGDWELAFSGRPLVTLERTRVLFEDGRGLDVDIDPRRVRLDRSIRFLSDLIKSYGESDSGFFLEMLEEEGLPAGIAARIDLPLPPLSFGAFSATGLRFSSSFALSTSRASGGRRGDFALSTTLALGRKSEPFVLRVWIFVGGGWLETRARYFPASGKLSTAVSIGLTAGLGLDFAFGPCRGFVFAMFGAYAEFESGGPGGANFSIAVIFLLRGGIVILGRFNIGLSLLMELVYRDDGTMVGRGTIEVSFKICWCCEIKVRQGVTYHLRKSSGGKSAPAAAAPPRPHYLDSFA